jgi:hypothetical protein
VTSCPPSLGSRGRGFKSRRPGASENAVHGGRSVLWSPTLCRLSVRLQAARRPGRPRRRHGARPALPLRLPCRLSRAAGRLSRRAEHSGRFLTYDVHQTVAEPEHPAVPLADSRLAQGPLAGPHNGQFRAGGEPPSAGTGYEAPRKSGIVQLLRAGSHGWLRDRRRRPTGNRPGLQQRLPE